MNEIKRKQPNVERACARAQVDSYVKITARFVVRCLRRAYVRYTALIRAYIRAYVLHHVLQQAFVRIRLEYK